MLDISNVHVCARCGVGFNENDEKIRVSSIMLYHYKVIEHVYNAEKKFLCSSN